MIPAMNTDIIDRRIEEIKTELTALGRIHPGSLSRQYNVCGSPGCRCKDPKHPRKHGPYNQLSWTWRGKSRTAFVKEEELAEMEQQVRNYRRFRELVDEWVDLAVERRRAQRSA
jgi:hypothetical protein